MDWLQLGLYAFASFVALRSLVSMMSSHKARYTQRRWAEVSQQQKNAISSPQPPNNAKQSNAGKPAA